MTTPRSASRPKPVPVDPDGISDALKAIPRWVVWRYVEDVDPGTGEVDFNKPPVNARTGGPASSTNPKTWTTFAEALAAYQRGGLDGIGFVLHRKKAEDGKEEQGGLVGVDLDHCRDPKTGEIQPWALEIIRELDTYAEVSPSGAGVRLFLYGALPPHGRKKGDFECYQSGRYVTVTGAHIDGTPRAIEKRQDQVQRVHARIFGDKREAKKTTPRAPGAMDLDDAEIVRRASEAKKGAGDRFARLWRGEIAGHNSASEADLALCNYLAFWCGPDEGRIADLFAQSGLYRSKWTREDYRRRTIGKALSGRTEFYTPRGRAGRNGTIPHSCNGQASHKDNGRVRPDADGRLDPEPTPERGDAWEPSSPFSGNGVAGEPSPEDAAHLTDRGNAIRFRREHGHDLRHCHPWRKWLCWDGRRWRIDDVGAVKLRAKRLIAAMFRAAVRQVQEIQKQLEELADDGDEE